MPPATACSNQEASLHTHCRASALDSSRLRSLHRTSARPTGAVSSSFRQSASPAAQAPARLQAEAGTPRRSRPTHHTSAVMKTSPSDTDHSSSQAWALTSCRTGSQRSASHAALFTDLRSSSDSGRPRPTCISEYSGTRWSCGALVRHGHARPAWEWTAARVAPTAASSSRKYRSMKNSCMSPTGTCARLRDGGAGAASSLPLCKAQASMAMIASANTVQSRSDAIQSRSAMDGHHPCRVEREENRRS